MGARYEEEEQKCALYTRELHVARTERQSEIAAARAHDRRAERAIAAREEALASLSVGEEAAVRALRTACTNLEDSFSRERKDFQERDLRAQGRIQELEVHLDDRRRSALETNKLRGHGGR